MLYKEFFCSFLTIKVCFLKLCVMFSWNELTHLFESQWDSTESYMFFPYRTNYNQWRKSIAKQNDIKNQCWSDKHACESNNLFFEPTQLASPTSEKQQKQRVGHLVNSNPISKWWYWLFSRSQTDLSKCWISVDAAF